MFSTKLVLSFISAFISPGFYTSTMLQIVFPFTLVHSAIYMFVNSSTIGFIICPEPVIYITINMNEFPFSMSSVFSPLSNIFSTVRPGLLAVSIPKPTFPLARIYGSCFEFIRWSLFSCLIWFVQTFCYSLSSLFLSKIL